MPSAYLLWVGFVGAFSSAGFRWRVSHQSSSSSTSTRSSGAMASILATLSSSSCRGLKVLNGWLFRYSGVGRFDGESVHPPHTQSGGICRDSCDTDTHRLDVIVRKLVESLLGHRRRLFGTGIHHVDEMPVLPIPSLASAHLAEESAIPIRARRMPPPDVEQPAHAHLLTSPSSLRFHSFDSPRTL